MTNGYKRLLLEGCREVYGQSRRRDTVHVVCDGGDISVSILVLSSLAPWLKAAMLDIVEQQDVCLVLPTLKLDDFITFVAYLQEERNTFDQTDLRLLECAVANVGCLFGISLLTATELEEDDEDVCLTAVEDHEEEVVSTKKAEEEEEEEEKVYLADLHPDKLNEETITENFSDQDGRLVCLVCYKIFSSSSFSAFRKHLAAHPKATTRRIRVQRVQAAKRKRVAIKMSFKCDTCGKTFKKRTTLNQHCQRDHGLDVASTSSSEHVCEECSYKCVNASGLKAHVKSHLVKTFYCPSCQRRFLSDKQLQVHLRHGSCLVQNRQCPICEKVYSDTTRLKYHMRFHAGDKSWQCSVCSKTFSERRTLKEHLLTHKADRQHHCTHCTRTFVQKNHMLYHLATLHGVVPPGSKKHVCKICSRTYAFAFQLKKHESVHVNKLAQHFKSAKNN